MLPKLATQWRMPRARRWIWWLITIGAISVGYAGWQHVRVAGAVVSASQQPSQSPAPIHVAPVERTDFPVVLNGLGTVQATNTVTVRSRVDGQIEKVGFEEGQMVREGDLLVQIDPAHSRRPSIKPLQSWRRTKPA